MRAAALPTRFQLPPEATGEAQGVPLEFVHSPLYSAVAYDAAPIPSLQEAFTYLQGQNVAGAGSGVIAATGLHTNMQAVRTIPRPQTFLVTGIRIVVPPVAIGSTVALADDSVGTALENNDQVDDLQLIYHSMALRFSIGQVPFFEAPFIQLPANAGIDGPAAVSVSNTNAASIFSTRVAIHTAGIGCDFSTGRRPVLWNQQTFRCELLCEWATNPTLNDQHLIVVVLDGVHGRELQ